MGCRAELEWVNKNAKGQQKKGKARLTRYEGARLRLCRRSLFPVFWLVFPPFGSYLRASACLLARSSNFYIVLASARLLGMTSLLSQNLCFHGTSAFTTPLLSRVKVLGGVRLLLSKTYVPLTDCSRCGHPL